MKRLAFLLIVCLSSVGMFGQQVTGAVIEEVKVVKKNPTGFLELKVTPANAVVYIDGIRWNGAEQVRLDAGTHMVYASAEKYIPQTKEFVIEKNKTYILKIDLSPEKVVVSEPKPAPKVEPKPEPKPAPAQPKPEPQKVEKPKKGMQGKHEIGAVVGTLVGFSYKYWCTEHFSLQGDLAAGWTYFNNISFVEGYSRWENTYGGYYTKIVNYHFSSILDFTLNLNLAYNYALSSNFYIYAGGGINGGYLTNLESLRGNEIESLRGNERGYRHPSDKVNMAKGGANLLLGLEYVSAKKPFSFGLDFRPGYGMAYYDGKWDAAVNHYFDWKAAFSLRYILE